MLPTRADVERAFGDLLAGSRSREEIHDWAARWVLADDVDADDWGVWQALGALMGADAAGGGEREYLFGESDFLLWRGEFRLAGRERG